MGAVVAVEIPEWFRAQMRRLIGLKFAPSDLTTHWEALHDLPEVLIAAGVERAQQACASFPAPWMLRSYGEQARARLLPVPEDPDRVVELDAPVVLGTLPTGLVLRATREWRYYCEACRDSGWRDLWCGDGAAPPWYERGVCGRNRDHLPHGFVVACPCASSNPDILRRQERQRQAGVRGSEHE